MNSNNIIEVKNLYKKFKSKVANKNISFNIKEFDRVGIIGGNGAGKTTLVEQLIGISKPTSGKIKYDFDFKESPQEKMGMQFQDSSYPEGLSVKDVITFSLEIYGSRMSEEDLDKLLVTFQIKDFYHHKAKSLSGGQQQKLNVLLAILHNPKIVILDEISTGLDISAREEIFSYIQKLIDENKMTLILISHDMIEIEKLCNRLLVLDKGELIKDDTVENIKKEYDSLSNYISGVINKGHKSNNDQKVKGGK